MPPLRVLTLAPVVLLLALAGCGSGSASDPDAAGAPTLAQLAGSWTASGTAGKPPRPIVAAAPPVLTIADGQMSFDAGCNKGGGPVAITDGHLIADPLTMSAMACPGERGDQESWVVEMLSAKPKVRLEGPALTLEWNGHSLVLDRSRSTATGLRSTPAR